MLYLNYPLTKARFKKRKTEHFLNKWTEFAKLRKLTMVLTARKEARNLYDNAVHRSLVSKPNLKTPQTNWYLWKVPFNLPATERVIRFHRDCHCSYFFSQIKFTELFVFWADVGALVWVAKSNLVVISNQKITYSKDSHTTPVSWKYEISILAG